MKKLFVAAALVMGLGTSAAFADNFMVDSVTVTMINDFTPIEVKDLPAAVQEAITKNYAESTIKEAAVEAKEVAELEDKIEESKDASEDADK